jgi:hypothetical protein
MRNTFLMMLFSALLLASCMPPSTLNTDANDTGYFEYGVNVWHDDERNVTCWIFVGLERGGISCIPDWQLQEPE